MATYKYIAHLIERYRKNDLNENEKEELEAWRNHSYENQLLFNRLNDSEFVSEKLYELYSIDVNEEWGRIRHMFPEKRKRRFKSVLKYAALVAALTAGVVVIFSLLKPNRSGLSAANNKAALQQTGNGIPADGRRVELKLGDGRVVYLDSNVSGHIALQYKSVIYKRGNVLMYHWSTGNGQANLEYNTVSTPPARTFAVELADGSKAWLNAGSSITYPTVFTGAERRVQITGEVYFEVNPDAASFHSGGKKRRFVVLVNSPSGKGKGARIEVTGTHFNVNAYAEEQAIKTTLFQGKVRVGNGEWPMVNGEWSMGNAQPVPRGGSKPQSAKEGSDDDKQQQFTVLTPGQQAQVMDDGRIELIPYADIQEALAWRNNKLIFNDADIKKIMQQIGRRFDYEIIYNGKVDGHYTFSASCKGGISKVLEKLELAGGVQFEVEGRRIVVSSK